MEETKQDEKQTENEQRYEDEVEINDFPQTARWKVTSKVCVECFHQSWRQHSMLWKYRALRGKEGKKITVKYRHFELTGEKKNSLK